MADAVRARLTAESLGIDQGDTATATSLSQGDAAVADLNLAAAVGRQHAAGDTTDYGFDLVRITA